jgi:hypothetical protein
MAIKPILQVSSSLMSNEDKHFTENCFSHCLYFTRFIARKSQIHFSADIKEKLIFQFFIQHTSILVENTAQGYSPSHQTSKTERAK